MEKEMRRIVYCPWGNFYMSLKPNGVEGTYHTHGHTLKDLRALFGYVQGTKDAYTFDLSEVNGKVKQKLEDIINGKKVMESDWNPQGEHGQSFKYYFKRGINNG